MKPEIEVKFYPVNKELIREQLSNLNAKLKTSERLMKRVVYRVEQNPQIQGDYIRVRDEGDIVRVSLKIHAESTGDIHDQKELDYLASSFDSAREMFNLIGLKEGGYQETLRETWDYKNCEITIDTWPCLESYIEIESNSEENIKIVSQDLKMKWSERRITSVVEVYAEKYNLTVEEVHEKLTNITFETNPFDKN